MTRADLQLIDQAEFYSPDTYVMIRNEKTSAVLDSLVRIASRPCKLVPDISEFLDCIQELGLKRTVIVTLGDSLTANLQNWPSQLADMLRNNGEDAVVVNLADWATISTLHGPKLDFFLSWLRSRIDGRLIVLFFGGYRDVTDRLVQFEGFLNGTPANVFIDGEDQFANSWYGRQLRRLHSIIPSDREMGHRWIVRRVIAAVKGLGTATTGAGGQFVALLQPFCYPDLAPSYIRGLEEAARATRDQDTFKSWCEAKGYYPDVSAFHGRLHPGTVAYLRPIIDLLRTAWREQKKHTSQFADLSELFRDETRPCFQPQADAMHYNTWGSRLIAEKAFSAIQPHLR